MDIKQYKIKQLELQGKLLKEFYEIKNPSQIQKDLFNLKYSLYQIYPYSHLWRSGMCGTLKRAIKALENQEVKS